MRTFKKRIRPSRTSIGSGYLIRRAVPEEENESAKPETASLPARNKLSKPHTGTVEYSTFKTLPVERLQKLGESTFSEIFINPVSNLVYKIVPLTKEKQYKRVEHTKIEYFIKECVIMKEMNISNYSTKMTNWWIVDDRYPQQLIDVCKKWSKENKHLAENVTPQRNNSSGLFGVIEMEHGGMELSKVSWKSITANEMQSIIDGIKLSIKYLDLLQIEHRDLHESNILVQRTEKMYSIRIIDYSLSRMSWYGTAPEGIKILSTLHRMHYQMGEQYTDLDREMPWLFTADETSEPHRRVYKEMAQAYTGPDRWRHTGNSNQLWLKYLLNWVQSNWKEQQG